MDVNIKFEIENKEPREGKVAVNTYLSDAAKRLGVALIDETDDEGKTNADAAVYVTQGAELLSTPTSVEMQNLTDEQRTGGARLASQTRIQTAGDIVVMIKEKATEQAAEEKERDWRKDFKELPFEKKFTTLVQLESVALGETINFVMNLPYTIGSKVVDVLAGFGWEMDKQKQTANRPAEHQSSATAATEPEKPAETVEATNETAAV